MDKIPHEILCEIFRYLSFRDRRQMALVNTEWYYASIHPQFARNEVFAFYEKSSYTIYTDVNSRLSLFNEFKSVLLNSKRKYFNLKLQGSLYVDHVSPIFINLANDIVSICLDNLHQFTNSLLDDILICNKLEQLEFKNVRSFGIMNIPRTPILSLKRILFHSTVLSDYHFNTIMQCAPNLEDLGFNCCSVLVFAKLMWPRPILEFYPNYRNPELKTNNLSVVNVVNYLQTAKNINKLRLGEKYKIIFDLPLHIKLVSLEINMEFQYFINQDFNELRDKICNHRTLENLNLKFVPCCLLESCIPQLNNLRALKLIYFELESCNNSGECMRKVIDSLKNKKKLRELKMFSLKHSDISLLSTPLRIPDCTLKSLTLYKGPINSGLKLVITGRNLVNLKILNGNILAPCDYKLLFKYLIKLRKLDIDKCFELNDIVLSDLPISGLRELRFLRFAGTKLTYQCLKYINNSQLREVCITNVSLEPCIALNSLSDFKNVLKIFSNFVPELTQLSIYFKQTQRGLDVKILDHFSKLIKSLHFKLKKLRNVYFN